MTAVVNTREINLKLAPEQPRAAHRALFYGCYSSDACTWWMSLDPGWLELEGNLDMTIKMTFVGLLINKSCEKRVLECVS